MDETGKTALHYGARFGHKEVLRFLIAKAPARVLDMVDSEKGQTALHKAAGYKRRTICCMLVAAGASLLIKVSQLLIASYALRAPCLNVQCFRRTTPV